MHRNVLLMFGCQALSLIANSVFLTTSALIGFSLLEQKHLATAPHAALMAATMAAAMPASLLMKRIGRRNGFMLGALSGLIGGVLCLTALTLRSFPLFLFGAVLMGVANTFSWFYRFAAPEAATPEFRSQAISLVVAGGVISAALAPQLVIWTREMLPLIMFAGSYVILLLAPILCMLLLLLIDIPPVKESMYDEPPRPLSKIAAQPVFGVAVFAAVTAFACMVLIMAATPLAVVACNHGIDGAMLIIQWHALAMFAPSFFTGHLIRRFGLLNIMAIGAFLEIATVIPAFMGTTMGHFWIALMLLGLGWNFMFVGATSLLTYAHIPSERAKVQGINDFAIWGFVAMASLASGAVHEEFGWIVLNLCILPMLLVSLLSILWLRQQRGAAFA